MPRGIFEDSFENESELQYHIAWTFAERDRYDDSFPPPSELRNFTFVDYHTSLENTAYLPNRLPEDEEYILWLIDEIREMRNGLYHFREGVEDIDRELLENMIMVCRES